MFIDEIVIRVRSGAGGAGSTSFRREKFVPRGGPDGGDGGRGGDVVLRATAGLNTLSHLRGRRVFTAADGVAGGKSLRHGASAEDVTILVPVGTVATDLATGDPLGELTVDGAELTVALGGRGGRGNTHFAHSRNQAPKFAELGEQAVEVQLQLELRLIADVGLVGAPNAGKSTLLKALTQATPKIGDYPFTTLEPNLGVASLEDDSRLVLADVPGLVEGASEGVGLGTDFLRHLARTALVVHVLDCSRPLAECRRTWDATTRELSEYDPELAARVVLAALNKTDLPGARRTAGAMAKRLEAEGLAVHAISAATGEGLEGLLDSIGRPHASARAGRPGPLLRVYRPRPVREKIRVDREGDVFVVRGRPVESVVAQTNIDSPEGLTRMRAQLEVAGLRDALLEAGVEPGDTIVVGRVEFVFDPNL